MNRTRGVLSLALALAFVDAHGATIYLCRAYSGGSFWSSEHCQKHNALIQRIVTVPDNMPFEQQVRLGQQSMAQAEQSTGSPQAPAAVPAKPKATTQQNECKSLDAQIRALDALARRPQSGASQDRITAERHSLRDRQFRLGCQYLD